MTIRKGQAWGEPGRLPTDGFVAHSDAAAAEIVAEAAAAGRKPPMIGLLGGDLCRTLSGPGSEPRLHSEEARRYPVDVGHAVVNGESHVFVAHVIARRSWWWGRVIAVMNAQWLGAWDLGPRSHPNDGVVDISDGSLSFGDRLKARRRLATGTHLPHPRISTARTAHRELTFEKPLKIWIDGVLIGSSKALVIDVEPDACTVVI